ncbi:cation:proton antiporter [Shimazuella soli]|uniref:cation:proton antiporter domain-containing protein n=1 Tax=Shimazuella soli TaxID=1892854 RepID=UPI001F0F0D29|nr:cation:proton antiporter [Shimazuella soli]
MELSILLLAIATGVTAIAKKFGIAYPIALVIVGTIVGLFPIPELEELKSFVVEDEIFHFIIISIFLPALLGEATLKLSIRQLKENQRSILSLAILGTLLSFVTVGFLSMKFISLPIVVAFTFASLMAATDPVSVLSIFKKVGVNERLAIILEGESLANDGVAVVLFQISSTSLLLYVNEGWKGLGLGITDFLLVSVGGIAVGAILGYLFSKVSRYFDDFALEILLSLVLFYSAFLAAEFLHVSGVIAVVAAGLVLGNYGAKQMTPTTKLNIRNFWDTLALIANSIVFLMVGIEINRINFADRWVSILIAIVIVLFARAISVYLPLWGNKTVPIKWRHTINWGGLRGALSIALALSLPLSFPGREDIIVLAFSVVLFSLLVQGLTMKKFAIWMDTLVSKKGVDQYEEYLSYMQRYRTGQKELAVMRDQAALSPVLYDLLQQEYAFKIDQVQRKMEELYRKNPSLQIEQQIKAKRRSLYAEYDVVSRLEKNSLISSEVADHQHQEIMDALVNAQELSDEEVAMLKKHADQYKQEPSKSIWIISDQHTQLGNALLKEMGKGVTYLHGEGAYTGEGKKVIFCVIHQSEEAKLNEIVQRVDPNAFLAVGNIHNVKGGK